MEYFVGRNGQTYGPYTLEDVQRYVSTGNIIYTDQVRAADTQEWRTVGQLLGVSTAAAPQPVAPPPAYAASSYPAQSAYPAPPQLSWGVLLIIDIFTLGLFQVVWNILLALWARRLDPRSTALFFYIAAVVLTAGNMASSMGNFIAALRHQAIHPNYLGVLLGLSSWVVRLIARYSLRDTLERHYNGPEPLGLQISPVLTFFFGGIYLTSKLNEVTLLRNARAPRS
ncbi:MAG: DUF4339 domain-containing protein [Acidobacteriota bacterium]|nr:DUF4339 domain-containing protein [Acidobacteriota bacterium]